jgi:threonine/homoserine/homoserine lactone efflux protein
VRVNLWVSVTTPKKPSFWAGFTPVDIRNFAITIAGTVIGGILLVMVGALAVIATRWFHDEGSGWFSHKGPPSVSAGLEQLAVLLAVALLVMVLSTRSIRRGNARTIDFAALGASIVFAVLAVLVLLGLAAGIK